MIVEYQRCDLQMIQNSLTSEVECVGALVGVFVGESVGAPTISQVASSHRPHLPFFMLPSELVEVAHHQNDSSVLSLDSDGYRRSLVQLVYALSLYMKGNLHCLTSAVQPVLSVKFLGLAVNWFKSIFSTLLD